MRESTLRRSLRWRPMLWLLVPIVLSLLLSGCSSTGTGGSVSGEQAASSSTPPETSAEATPFEGAASKVVPVVVFVGIEQALSTPQGSQNVPVGNGSGIVIRPDGYILTNNHVVSDSSAIMVGLGRTKIPGKVVGRDPSSDLAVIKIDKTGLTAAQIGDPKQLKRGQWVIAVGSPYGLERTVTSGIVSALNRSTLDVSGATGTAYTNMIQTDAAINPGNSGGALATLDGKIVGVTALEDSPSGASAGIGLAIPIDFAMEVADQLIRTGKAVHPYIGVSVMDVDAHVAQMLGLTGVADGAMIQALGKGSTAARAGLQQGDVIASVGGLPVVDAATFYAAMRQQTIGSQTAVLVVRGGKKLTVQVKVAAGTQG